MNTYIHLLYVPTMACNMACKYCYLEEDTKDLGTEHGALETLAYAIDKCREEEIIPFNISLHGGEVTCLDPETFRELDRKAWETTLSRVDLSGSHKSTDACLVIIADTVDPEAARQVRKTDHYKSYRLGLKGWSTCRMTVYECQTGTSFCNRRGEDLSKLFQA